MVRMITYEEERRGARLKVWDESMASPTSEADKRFWEELARDQQKLRRKGTSAEEPV